MRLFRRLLRASAVPAVPAGVRLYAIGDVHGRADLLDALLAAIEADSAARGAAEVRLILLGDLVDRGDDSRGVVERVMALCAEGRATLIKGNHEDLFVAAFRGDAQAARVFLGVGGRETLASYGITAEEADAGTFADFAALLKARVPAAHIELLDGAADHVEIGDYLFVHAGIRPGLALHDQDPRELRWIRHEFTTSERDHGHVVVHGHTITDAVEMRHNRIGLDTGAFASGRLTALGLEGTERWILDTASHRDRAVLGGAETLG